MNPLIMFLGIPIILNLVGFIVASVNYRLYHTTPDKQIDWAVTVVCFLGGALGILISTLMFEPSYKKSVLMSRVFLAVCLVIQLSVFFWILGFGIQTNVLLLLLLFPYLIIINIIAFIAYGVDKKRASNGKFRLRNVFLLGLAFIGGTVGALLAMRLFNHKVNKKYYTCGVPLMMIMHLVVFVLLIL